MSHGTKAQTKAQDILLKHRISLSHLIFIITRLDTFDFLLILYFCRLHFSTCTCCDYVVFVLIRAVLSILTVVSFLPS